MPTQTIKQPVLTAKAISEMENLKKRPVDLTDEPEVLDWSNAKRGMFKFAKHYELQSENSKNKAFDDDVIEWVAKQDTNTKIHINEMLRHMMLMYQPSHVTS